MYKDLFGGYIMDCKLNLPYPEVKTEGKNLHYAALLTEDLAGRISELSAVNQYTFQFITEKNKVICETVKCISMVEMHHLSIISKLICCFGGVPRYAKQCGCDLYFWNGRFVSYECTAANYLKSNISSERLTIDNYTKRISQINDKCAQKCLERIIKDEEHHIKLFEDLLKRCCT